MSRDSEPESWPQNSVSRMCNVHHTTDFATVLLRNPFGRLTSVTRWTDMQHLQVFTIGDVRDGMCESCAVCIHVSQSVARCPLCTFFFCLNHVY